MAWKNASEWLEVMEMFSTLFVMAVSQIYVPEKIQQIFTFMFVAC